MPPVLAAIPAAFIAGGVAAIEGATLAAALGSAAIALTLGTVGNLLVPTPRSHAGITGSVGQPFRQKFSQGAQ
jgi:hypothetical protein